MERYLTSNNIYIDPLKFMKNWKETILKSNNTMIEAISLLDKVETKIVMVIDHKGRLVGTITDGDIRRAIINKHGMEEKLSKFMYKNPTVASKTNSESYIQSIMKERMLRHIPIVDKFMNIIDLRSEEDFDMQNTKDNPVFIMAGGFGTRLQPLTNETPKPLLNVGGRPILQIIISQFIEAGFHNFYISTHYKAEMLKEFFFFFSNLDVSIKYIVENTPLGTAGALGLLPSDLPDLPLIVMNGDLLTKVDFEGLLQYHNDNNFDVTMAVRNFSIQVPYGVVEIEDKKIKSIVEKPIQHFFVNAGIYVISKSIIKLIEKDRHLDMTTLLSDQLEKSKNIAMFPIHEYWLDIGQHEQLEQAQSDSKIFNNFKSN